MINVNETTIKTVVGPQLKRLLIGIFFLIAFIFINSFYLSLTTFLEWITGKNFQDQTYLHLFLAHLIMGLLVIVPFIIYGVIHLVNTIHRKQKRAIIFGCLLFFSGLVLLLSGILLTRGVPVIEIKNTHIRNNIYWLHFILPLVVIFLYINHRKTINWKPAFFTLFVAIIFSGILLWYKFVYINSPIITQEATPLFSPSLAKTAHGKYYDVKQLDNNSYCKNCHQDIHNGWMNSVHKVSSFNNKAYAFAVNKTRNFLMKRDSNHTASRLCAACHDPVILFSGAFDKNVDFSKSPIGSAGISCTVCHAISKVNSVKGNGAYTLSVPEPYPFTDSELPFLQWVNRTLVKAKPKFHKASYLKPLHKTAEFCSVCHKVALPKVLNHYKWLRGQNHYDSFFLSAVAGHSVSSYYYPTKAIDKCAQCHMPEYESDDFGAKPDSLTSTRKIHSHYFEAANTAIRQLNHLKEDDNNSLLQGSLSLDLFGIRQNGKIDGEIIAPLNTDSIELQAGKRYLLEAVIRNVKLGHDFTQGTSDSNQVWLELSLYHNGKLLGLNGGLNEFGEVDKWAYFINTWALDKNGKRIDRRNGEEIFTSLYNHSIPPGSATVVHYSLDIPEGLTGDIMIEAKIAYRKFDTNFYRQFQNSKNTTNKLPITTITKDTQNIHLSTKASSKIPVISNWLRWNDYGIGMLRQEAFKQADEAFSHVIKLDKTQGLINLTRSLIKQGNISQAQKYITQASKDTEFDYPWQLSYFKGLLHYSNGEIDHAIKLFKDLYETKFPLAQEAGFDFSKDYKFVTLYGQVLFQKAMMESKQKHNHYFDLAIDKFNHVLALNPEWSEAHYALSQIYTFKNNNKLANYYSELHQKYKQDDNAKNNVIAKARQYNKAADHATNNKSIYTIVDKNSFITVNAFCKKHTICTSLEKEVHK